MDDTNNTFGFELLQQLYDSKILKKEDVIVLFVHWCLIKRGLRCIGFGDSKAFDASDKGTELLPEEWNTHPNYTLRYLKDGKLFILHAIRSDEEFLINLLRVQDNDVTTIQFPINETVQELHGRLELMIPSYQTIMQNLRKDLIDSLIPSTKKDTSVQASSDELPAKPHTEVPSPLREDPTHLQRARHPALDPRNVGGSDLDPFGQGGGMLFNPFGPNMRNPLGPGRPGLGVPGRLPPGAVPPGARFDPFGPLDNNPPMGRRLGPDNDHLPPPGYDDMFM